MTNIKRQMMIEVASDLVHKVHHDLCRSRKIKESEQTFEIQRQLSLLSDMLKKGNCDTKHKPNTKPEPIHKLTPETLAAINALGRQIHPNE